MGRVKVPRCDNCGAPVEFATGVLEARCEYCDEVLIREFAAEPPPAPPPVQRYVPPVVAHNHMSKVWPLLIVSGATVAIAGASGVATLATSFKPLLQPASEVSAPVDALAERRNESTSFAFNASQAQSEIVASKTPDAGTRPRSTRPKAPAAPAPTSTEPPKPPQFNSQAAVAALDAAKAKAEASCKSVTIKSLFVQIGFDPDGKNRRAAVSDPKKDGTPEAKCVLKIFRAVRIPAFDPATKPGGLGRMVRL